MQGEPRSLELCPPRWRWVFRSLAVLWILFIASAGIRGVLRSESGVRPEFLFVMIAANLLIFGVGVPLATRSRRLVVDQDTARLDSAVGGFAVPLGSIVRMSVFHDLGLLHFTIESRSEGRKKFWILGPSLQQQAKPILDEIETRSGQKWVGAGGDLDPAEKIPFFEALRTSARVGSRAALVRWMAARSFHISIDQLGINDKLVRGGFQVLSGRVLWTLLLLQLLLLADLSAMLKLAIFLLVLLVWIHTSLGVNIILTLMHGVVRRREMLEHELDTARSVQQRLAPQRTPESDIFDIAGICVPAKQVGGDYFDYIEIPGGGIAATVADVSGKGLGPGLLMTLTKGALVSSFKSSASVGDALSSVNATIRGAVQQSMFVSMAIAELLPSGRRIAIARAGHNPPLVVRRDGSTEWISPPGIALGLVSSAIFGRSCQAEQIDLAPGDLLLLYTDGLTEAMNEAAEEYGEERLAVVAAALRGRSARTALESILDDVARFRGRAEVNDDLTLVVIAARGGE